MDQLLVVQPVHPSRLDDLPVRNDRAPRYALIDCRAHVSREIQVAGARISVASNPQLDSVHGEPIIRQDVPPKEICKELPTFDRRDHPLKALGRVAFLGRGVLLELRLEVLDV